MNSVKPKKFLGQHFLTDLSVAQRIADTIDACPDIPVLEVGPGMGVLTQYIIPKGREFKVVEIDFDSVPYLHEHFPQLGDNIIEGDFLQMNLHEVFGGRPFVLTGNYPYNISSQIFFKMVENKDRLHHASQDDAQWYEADFGQGLPHVGRPHLHPTSRTTVCAGLYRFDQ